MGNQMKIAMIKFADIPEERYPPNGWRYVSGDDETGTHTIIISGDELVCSCWLDAIAQRIVAEHNSVEWELICCREINNSQQDIEKIKSAHDNADYWYRLIEMIGDAE